MRHHMGQGLSFLVVRQVLQKMADNQSQGQALAAAGAVGYPETTRNMGRYHKVRYTPGTVVGGKGLFWNHINRGAAKRA